MTLFAAIAVLLVAVLGGMLWKRWIPTSNADAPLMDSSLGLHYMMNGLLRTRAMKLSADTDAVRVLAIRNEQGVLSVTLWADEKNGAVAELRIALGLRLVRKERLHLDRSTLLAIQNGFMKAGFGSQPRWRRANPGPLFSSELGVGVEIVMAGRYFNDYCLGSCSYEENVRALLDLFGVGAALDGKALNEIVSQLKPIER